MELESVGWNLADVSPLWKGMGPMKDEDVIEHFLANTTEEEKACFEAGGRRMLFQSLADKAEARARGLFDEARMLMALHAIYANIAGEIEVPCG